MKRITIPAGNSDTRIRITNKTEEQAPLERIGVSVSEAAQMISLSERTLWTLIKEQKIHAVRLGTRCIVSVQSLRDFIDGKANL